MRAKRTSKSQITLPKATVHSTGEAEDCDMSTDGVKIVSTPARLQSADAVRQKLHALGIKAADVSDAIAWASQRA